MVLSNILKRLKGMTSKSKLERAVAAYKDRGSNSGSYWSNSTGKDDNRSSPRTENRRRSNQNKFAKRNNGHSRNRYSNRDITTLTLATPDMLNNGYKKINLVNEVKSRFKGNYSDLDKMVYGFMKDFVFNDNNFDYEGIQNLGQIAKYFGRLSELKIDKGARQALESARTILLHLNDYLSRENRDRKGSFKKYLFGENGVLTKRRLNDMRSVVKQANKLKDCLVESSEKRRIYYGFEKGDEIGRGFNKFNVAYRNHESGRILVDINDNDSDGMYACYGKLYWESFDKMFDGRVNTRRSIKKYVKSYINRSVREGCAQDIEGYAWFK